jgi:hypothetical protein
VFVFFGGNDSQLPTALILLGNKSW